MNATTTVVISTGRANCKGDVYGRLIRAGGRKVLAECDVIRPMGCEDAAMDDARRLAARLGWTVAPA